MPSTKKKRSSYQPVMSCFPIVHPAEQEEASQDYRQKKKNKSVRIKQHMASNVPLVKKTQLFAKSFRNAHHVRVYGLDIENRLRETGFKVDVLRASDIPAESVKSHVLEYPSPKKSLLYQVSDELRTSPAT